MHVRTTSMCFLFLVILRRENVKKVNETPVERYLYLYNSTYTETGAENQNQNEGVGEGSLWGFKVPKV